MDFLSLTLPGGQTIQPPKDIPSGGINIVEKLFKNSFTLMIILCVVLALIFIIIGGIQWITSGGDKTKLQAARSKLTWSVIGLVVAFSAFFIIALIGFFFKVDLMKFN
jgi:hypothetical protein